MTVIAGNLDQLAGLQRNFHRYSGDVDGLMAALRQELEGAYWQGGRAGKFRDAWHAEYEPALRRISQALVQAGDECANSASDLHCAGG